MNRRPCIFGEVLFDFFPDGRRVLGGAPFNVAWNLRALGVDPLLVSRVGTDADGDSVRSAMKIWGMDEQGLQLGPGEHTGRVIVSIEDGEPSYDILHPVAWDEIEAPADPPTCGLLYHGSLALRSARSRDALHSLRDRADKVFLDVNLRDPWWTPEGVSELLPSADWLKVNDDELRRLSPAGDGAESRARGLLERHSLEALLLTRGERGASLFLAGGETLSLEPAGVADVVDTVGAGDAFSAVMILGILRDWPLPLCLERAQSFASAVVGQRGATVHDPAFYRPFVDDWSDA